MTEKRRQTDSCAAKKASSPPKPARKKGAESARKGKLVEAVVALLHDMPGVKVEKNVFLPPRTRGPNEEARDRRTAHRHRGRLPGADRLLL